MDSQPLRDHARILIASLVGTAVEYYDFFIYATAAALVFGPLFFPAQSEAAQTLLAFMSFGIAFVARPIGAIAFGHFGDRIGRKSTLVASLLLMGVSTLAIAFLPTYAMVGWVAPALLCLMRFGQGFGLGGEWGGAALLAVENAPKGWEARFGAAPQLGVPVGFMAANGLFLVLGFYLSDADFLAWGWRVPFVASAALVVLGLWVRLKISETPEFRAALSKEPPLPVPIATLLRRHFGAVLAGSAGVVSTYALFYLATAFALAEATGPLGYQRETFLGIQLFANLFLVLGIVLAATHADRGSPAGTILRGALVTAVIGLVFSPTLGAGSLPLATLLLIAAMIALGFNNAPLGSWLSGLFPVRVRYSGVSLAFNTGGIVGGALTPIAAQTLSAEGAGHYTGLLLTVAGLMTFGGVLLSRSEASREDAGVAVKR
ncbi:MAG TPA: MFS transporter [Sphingobium sp.]|nr:MFS transporter [Sphingobium sp.]